MPQLVLLLMVAGLLGLLQTLAPTGTLRAAFIGDNPVQGRVDPETGTVTGPAADLVEELARRVGVPYLILPAADVPSVIESVRTGKADIGFLAYEAARAEQVDFSHPYLLSSSTYLVRADSNIRSTADVDRPGVRIGAVKGQSPQIHVSAHIRNAHIEVLPSAPTAEAMAAMLLNGEIDAFAANRQRLEEAAESSPGLLVLPDSFMIIEQAIVVEKGNQAALNEINRFLADALASGFVKASLDRARLAGVEVAQPR